MSLRDCLIKTQCHPDTGVDVYDWAPDGEAEFYGALDPYSDAGSDFFRQAAESEGFSFYCREKINFNINEAAQLARDAGKWQVIVENLS